MISLQTCNKSTVVMGELETTSIIFGGGGESTSNSDDDDRDLEPSLDLDRLLDREVLICSILKCSSVNAESDLIRLNGGGDFNMPR